MSDSVTIFEVGPRDGLQNEKNVLPLNDRLWLLETLVQAGVKQLEAGSMVRPDKVPQMADSEKLHPLWLQSKVQGMNPAAEMWYLVPNEKGFERAIQAGIKNIAVFTAVSESFNRKNIGMSVDESFQQIEAIIKKASTHSIKTRAYVSTVWGCPFEGRIEPKQSIKVVERLLALGIHEVSIGDTIGVAAPEGVSAVYEPLLSSFKTTPPPFAAHFHDTRGAALVNSIRAFELGVRTFDASIGGLGGCPFAPGAAGNLATEDLVYMMKEMGINTGVNYKALCETSLALFSRMNKKPQSKAVQAYLANCNVKNAWDF